jgi:hypothetical protein
MELFRRGTSLAQALEGRVSGTVQIALRQHVDPVSAVTSLRYGGVSTLGPAMRLLVATIERHLRTGADHVVVLQHFNARLGDEVLKRSRLEWRDVDGEIYYLLTRDSEGDQIEVAVRKAMDVYSFFCAFTKGGESASQIPIGREIVEHWARETNLHSGRMRWRNFCIGFRWLYT